MKTFKTPKGTELPLLNLKGKDYLQVAYRLVWFREDHPNATISTEIISNNETYSLVKASILTDKGIMAVAHKREDAKSFPDYMEKAETGAIGRALALYGYGTQFTEDLDEGARIVDSPVVVPKATVGYAAVPFSGDVLGTAIQATVNNGAVTVNTTTTETKPPRTFRKAGQAPLTPAPKADTGLGDF